MLVKRGFRIVETIVVLAAVDLVLSGNRITAIDRLGNRADIVASAIVMQHAEICSLLILWRIHTKEQTMNSQTTTQTAADEDAICAIHQRMIDAWNAGDGAAFAAPFTDDADFVVWEGTHLKGRQEIASFTQRIFDTVVTGSRLEGEVKFVRLLSPALAVMHSVVRMAFPGQTATTPSRDSMELTVLTKRDGVWRGEKLLNARRLTMDRQRLLDDLDSLPAEAQHQVSELVASLKKRHQRQKGRAS